MDDQVAEFEALAREQSRALLRSAWLLTGDWHAAQDLTQIALSTSWQRWQRVQAAADRAAYVHKILVNSYLSSRRRRWHNEVPTDSVRSVDYADPFHSADISQSVRSAMESLPRQQRAVVVLRYFLDLSEQQTAQAMGCRVGTVKSHCSRALKTLRSNHELATILSEGVVR